MAKEQILKVVDVLPIRHRTVFIFFPEKIFELMDTAKGCMINYTARSDKIVVAGVTARQMKRTIQEQLQDYHEIGFLKLHSDYQNHKGLRYINVNHISAVFDNGSQCEIKLEYHKDIISLDDANTLEVAAQIRRVIRRLDQDQEFCCKPEPAPEAETE